MTRIEKLETTVSNLYAQVQTMESEIFLLRTELEELNDERKLHADKRRHTEALPSSEPGDAMQADGL